MTYAQQKDFRDRAAAIAGVAAIHAAIAIGLVVGMTVVGVAPPIDKWDPFTLTPETKKVPPPPPPTPQPSQQAKTTTTIVAPIPPIRTQQTEDTNVVVDTGTTSTTDTFTDWNVLPTPTPSPKPLFAPKSAMPSNNRNGWISNDDYPASPLRNGIQGSVGYSLVIGTNGRVSACDVTRTSGNQALDDATCRLIRNRARFDAATDESGAKVVGTFSGTVRWEIPN